MNKIICYSCSNEIELKNQKALSQIECEKCRTTLTIPGVIEDFILEELISCNELYKTYKGFRRGEEGSLIIKVLNEPQTVTQSILVKLKSSQIDIPEECRLTVSKVKEDIVAYRKYCETSIQRYLESGRPKTEKALYILKEAALILENLAKKEVFPANLTIGNLLMDENGKVILSDLMFKETLSQILETKNKEQLLSPHTISTNYMESGKATLKEPLFGFGCLAYLLCCGNYPWPFGSYKLVQKARNISPEVILDIRGDKPEELKSFISKLINEKEPGYKSFADAVKQLRLLCGEKVPKKTEGKKAKKPKKKSVQPAARAASIRRRKKRSSAVLPVAVCLTLILVAAALMMKPSSSSSEKTSVSSIDKKALKPVKQVKKTKTVEKQKAREVKLAVQEAVPQKPLELAQPVIEEKKVDRAAIKAELLPHDLNFDSLVSKLDEYIAATDPSKRELEEEKIYLVSSFRDNLLVRFYRRPYQGIFYLVNQKPFRGKISKADDETLHLVNLISDKPLTISWKELDFNQYEEFTSYYAASYTDDFSVSETNEKAFKKIAEEYKRLSVFLDWYGFHDKAVNYKKKAISFHEEVIASLNELVPEAQTN
ncbi:MAG: hypothetical protein NE327_22080 [Lentisphaeraceae bacterium]|nr:hypothetical protein [Lentisphaeraceae bacterium]